MESCIHLSHCDSIECTEACNTWAESTYLQYRNNCKLSHYKYDSKTETEIYELIKKCDDSEDHFIWRPKSSLSFIRATSVYLIDLFYSINSHKCSVYNLKFGSFIEGVRKTIDGSSLSDDIRYMSIWAESSEYLLISNLDYCYIGVIEYTRLMQLIQKRSNEGKHTIVFTSVPLSQMAGNKEMITLLHNRLEEVRI